MSEEKRVCWHCGTKLPDDSIYTHNYPYWFCPGEECVRAYEIAAGLITPTNFSSNCNVEDMTASVDDDGIAVITISKHFYDTVENARKLVDLFDGKVTSQSIRIFGSCGGGQQIWADVDGDSDLVKICLRRPPSNRILD